VKKAIATITMVLVTVGFCLCILYGESLGDFDETESVGSVMCLSCMGLQQ
jgi:hypothetical protein